MDDSSLSTIEDRLIAAWNSQDVERVVACYTDDLVYRDPNTRGTVEGADGMRRYLTKLFDAWAMHWTVKERLPFETGDGAAGLWRATFRTAGGTETVTVEGMDLILFEGDRVRRNEVYFDRAVLAPLLTASPAA